MMELCPRDRGYCACPFYHLEVVLRNEAADPTQPEVDADFIRFREGKVLRLHASSYLRNFFENVFFGSPVNRCCTFRTPARVSVPRGLQVVGEAANFFREVSKFIRDRQIRISDDAVDFVPLRAELAFTWMALKSLARLPTHNK